MSMSEGNVESRAPEWLDLPTSTASAQTTMFGVEPRKTKEESAREATIAREAWRKRVRQQLEELAREMLLDDEIHGGHGVAFYEVRHRAETRGWLSGEESGEFLSLGSSLMRRAGGTVCAHVASKHRNAKSRLVAKFKLLPPPIGDVSE